MKKGQVTIFIIIGMLLLGIVIFASITLNSKREELPQELNFDYDHASRICIETSAKSSIAAGFYLGSQNPNLNYVEYEESIYNPNNISDIIKITQAKPIYINKKINQYQPIQTEEIEQTISEIFTYYYEKCMSDLNLEQYYDSITMKDIVGNVQISEQTILFEINKNTIYTYQKTSYEKKQENYRINYELLEKINLINQYLEIQNKTDLFALSHITELAYNNNFEYLLRNYDENTIIIDFIFDDYKEITEKNLVHGFAIEFDWS